jgi:hypothetical protein
MQADIQTASVSKKGLWAGRIISALPALFLLMDGVMKLVKPAPVVEATVRLGYPERVLFGLGIVLLSCTIRDVGALVRCDIRLRLEWCTTVVFTP